MAIKKPLYQVPVASTGFVEEATFIVPQGILTYAYSRNGGIFRAGLRFIDVMAASALSESACTAWHIDAAYDTLIEIDKSSWVEEISQRIPPHRATANKLRHFMIYLDSTGCLEVIASNWELLVEERVEK